MTLPSPKTKRFVLQCPDNCSLRPDAIGKSVTGALTSMRENGAGAPSMAKRAAELLGRPVPVTNMSRHVNHFREVADDEPDTTGPRPSDVAILDAIIGAGYKNSRNWKPSIKDTLDAMKLKVQMTGQSAFEDMLAAMDAALDLEDEEGEAPENVEAIFSADERPDDDADGG